MKTDRELLETAARAAGIDGKWLRKASSRPTARNPSDVVEGFVICNPRGGQGKHWNPLIDDGDALRLVVRLGLRLSVANDLGVVFCTSADRETYQASEGFGADKQAATRRAVVRAAAQIGENS